MAAVCARTCFAGEFYADTSLGLVLPLNAQASKGGLDGMLSFKDGEAYGLGGGYRFDSGLGIGLQGYYLGFDDRNLTLGNPALAAYGGYYNHNRSDELELFPVMADLSWEKKLPVWGIRAKAGMELGKAKDSHWDDCYGIYVGLSRKLGKDWNLEAAVSRLHISSIEADGISLSDGFRADILSLRVEREF